MVDDRAAELGRKYLTLGLGELAAAAVFVMVAFTLAARLNEPGEQKALWSALIPLLMILVQGGGYWLSARTWIGRPPMPRTLARIYRGFRITDIALLAAGLAGIVAWWPDRLGPALLAVAVWGFGVVEYLNYFHVRLSYPPRRWLTTVHQWRTPRLIQDLRAAAR
ncbi:hypothetical protein [Nocardia cyriacigeorgica]|uniref:hypothetical protein n=1 Tax=Nocardia cyriacigeorgica TaxID=135487 RepID=UPI00245645D7|nr:hypothetical protein [Nocardia cyriacigeorgica]